MDLRLADPEQRYAAVRLCSELPLAERDYRRADGAWVLTLPPLPVARLEYELELTDTHGHSEQACDPGNPRRAPGAFGEKSVLWLNGYAPPAWLEAEAVAGKVRRLVVRDVHVSLWSPADARPRERLPLLVAHDGPEYDALAQLTHYAGAAIAAGTLPRHRVALLHPGDRDERYSASARYTRVLCTAVVPMLRTAVAVGGPIAGMGASLGGLAMLHAERRYPGTFGALFLQSGSFFMPRFDAHESRFPRYGRIVRFVRGALRDGPVGVPVVMTCGGAEENVYNNRVMARALGAELVEVPDLHNYTAWRDALDPHLTELLRRCWA
ncbi:MAG TPA: alpha/beta hydrolase-fold protein [Solirubrobacteraceae bacterium]